MGGRRVSKKLINKNNNIIIAIIIRQSDLLLLFLQIIGQSLRVRRVRGFSYSRTNDDAPTGRVADTDWRARSWKEARRLCGGGLVRARVGE